MSRPSNKGTIAPRNSSRQQNSRSKTGCEDYRQHDVVAPDCEGQHASPLLAWRMVLIRGEGEIRDQRKSEYAQGKYLGISAVCHELNKYYHGRPDTQQADGDERQFFV